MGKLKGNLKYWWQVFQTTEEGGDGGAGDAGDTGNSGNAEGSEDTGGDAGESGTTEPSGTDEGTGTDGESPEEGGKSDVPDEYNAPEGVEYPEGAAQLESIKVFNEMAKEAGLTQAQYEAVVKFDMARSSTIEQAAKAHTVNQHQSGLEEMQRTLGNDQFKETVAAAQKVMGAVKDEGLQKYLVDTDLGNSPQLISFFARFGKLISEDALGSMGAGQVQSKPNAAQGDSSIAKKFYPEMK